MYAVAIIDGNKTILGKRYTTTNPIGGAFKRLRVKYPRALLITVHITEDDRFYDIHDNEITVSEEL